MVNQVESEEKPSSAPEDSDLDEDGQSSSDESVATENYGETVREIEGGKTESLKNRPNKHLPVSHPATEAKEASDKLQDQMISAATTFMTEVFALFPGREDMILLLSELVGLIGAISCASVVQGIFSTLGLTPGRNLSDQQIERMKFFLQGFSAGHQHAASLDFHNMGKYLQAAIKEVGSAVEELSALQLKSFTNVKDQQDALNKHYKEEAAKKEKAKNAQETDTVNPKPQNPIRHCLQ